MKRNLGSAPMMFPQPVLIIATYDENRKAFKDGAKLK